MPAKTAVPSDCRISEPAPVATTSGATPKMNANDVIRIGRSRVRAAVTAASPGVAPASSVWRANSTIRIAFFAASPTSTTKPICASTSIAIPRIKSPVTEASRHIGTIITTASGRFQLSYCAASTRNTNRAAAPNTSRDEVPGCCCWNASSVHSKPMPGGSTSRASSSIRCSAVPVATPGAATPITSAAGNKS